MLEKSTKSREPWEGRVELPQKIVQVSAESPFVTLTFADGFSKQLDFTPYLKIGKIFTPLRNPEFFKTGHASEHGGALEWVTLEGQEIDFCADALRMQAEGIWDPINHKWTI